MLRFLQRAPRVLVALAVMVLAAYWEECASAADPRPNVLLILGDDHAAYALSCYDHPVVRTPSLDRLAERGARFTRAYCNAPMCTPSRQSLLTGRMPHAAGVTLLKTPLSGDEITLAEVLRDAGYRTAAIGKMHFNGPLDHGFEQRIDQPQFRQRQEAHPPAPLPDDLAVLGPWRPFRDPASSWLNAARLPYAARDADMAGTFYAQQAAERLQSTDQPFFLVVSFYEPHSPFHFPIEYAGRIDASRLEVPPVGPDDAAGIPLIFRGLSDDEKRGIAAAYYTSVEFLDKNVGLVLDALDASGRAENTLVIYAGDHGYQLGHHGRFEKHAFFEEAIRSPLLMAWSGQIAPRQVIDRFAEFVDLFPTIAAACRVDLPADRHGKSLLPLVAGAATDPPPHDAVFGIYGENEEAMIRTERWKLFYCSGLRARDDGYSTDDPTPGRYVKLFDLQADPGEMHNLATQPDQQSRVAELKGRLVDRLAETARPEWRAPAELSLDEQLDWYVFPVELRAAAGETAR